MNWTSIEENRNQLSRIESIDWQTDYEAEMEERKRSIDIRDSEGSIIYCIDGISPMRIRKNNESLLLDLI